MKLVVTTLVWFLTALEIALFARAILSWVSGGFAVVGKIRQLLYDITEPMLKPIRFLIQRSIFQGNGSIFDISPLIAYLIIGAVKGILT